MRIAFITPEFPSSSRPEGGLANYVRKTGSALVQRGHEFVVVVPGPRTRCKPTFGLEVHQIRVPFRRAIGRVPWIGPAGRHLWTAWILALALRRMDRASPFDVVMTSSYAATGLFAHRVVPTPTVCRVSSYAPLLRAAKGLRRNIATHLVEYLEIRQVAIADARFVPSQFMADVYERFESLPLQVLRTPVEPLHATCQPPALPSTFRSRPYLVVLGTLNRVKGLDILADILPGLLRDYPTVGVVLVGRDDGLPGQPSVVELIKDRVGPDHDRLHHIPPVSRDTWVPIVCGAVGAVMASRVDNYPNACLEVLSLGTPVVGTVDSSIDEIVKDGHNGFLVASGQPADLRRAIGRLLELPSPELERMRANARASMAAAAGEDRVGALESLLLSVVRERGLNRE